MFPLYVKFWCLIILFSGVNFSHGQQITEIAWVIPPDRTIQPFYFPAPIDNSYQRTIVRVDNGNYDMMTNIHGAQILKITPIKNPLRINFTVYSKWKNFTAHLREVPVRITNVSPAEARYLQKSPLADPDNLKIVQLATQLQGASVMQSLTNALRYFEANIPVTTEFKYWSSLDQIITTKDVQCEGRAVFFVALCRHWGIPARMNFMLNADFQTDAQGKEDHNKPQILGGHTFVEVYLPPVGWVQVNPYNDKQIGPCFTANFGYEPFPYYFLRRGKNNGILLSNQSARDFPEVWGFISQDQEMATMTRAYGFMFNLPKFYFPDRIASHHISAAEAKTLVENREQIPPTETGKK